MSTLTMLAALAGAGLVSPSELEIPESPKALDLPPEEGGVTLEDLKAAPSIMDFRPLAKKFLLSDPLRIQDALNAAHAFKGPNEGQRLIGCLFSLRTKLQKAGSEVDKIDLIHQAFRRARGSRGRGRK